MTNIAYQESVSDDAVLVEAARNDPDAFDLLYRRYVTRIYHYCYTHTYDTQATEDLAAQTFLAALEGVGGYRGRGSFTAWLFSIVSNLCKRYHRFRQRRDRSQWHAWRKASKGGLYRQPLTGSCRDSRGRI